MTAKEYVKPFGSLTPKQRALEASATLARRIVHDPRGIHHTTTPYRTFAEGVAVHARLRQASVAEALCVTQRLVAEGVLTAAMAAGVGVQGAARQAFHGTAERPACHVLHGQITVAGRFPWHFTRPGNGAEGVALGGAYLDRVRRLFARCTLQPALVNGIDGILDWHDAAGFADGFADAVRHVLAGERVGDVYEAFRARKRWTLGRLSALAEDVRFDVPTVVYLLGGRPSTPAGELALVRQEAARLCDSPRDLAALREAYLETLDVYHEQEWRTPVCLTSGALASEIAAEAW